MIADKKVKKQFVTDSRGRKTAVIISIKDYEKMIDELEELDDIKLYDEARKDKSEGVPIETAFKQLDAKRKRK